MLTDNILNNLEKQYPEITKTQNNTLVYALNIPGEINGAYVFHDYYSLQQAAKMKYKNDQLKVQAVGTNAILGSYVISVE